METAIAFKKALWQIHDILEELEGKEIDRLIAEMVNSREVGEDMMTLMFITGRLINRTNEEYFPELISDYL